MVESDCKPDGPGCCDCGLDGVLCGSGSLSGEDVEDGLEEEDDDVLCVVLGRVGGISPSGSPRGR